jgi:hypothetical protein
VFRAEFIGTSPIDPGTVNPTTANPGFLYLQRFNTAIRPYYSHFPAGCASPPPPAIPKPTRFQRSTPNQFIDNITIPPPAAISLSCFQQKQFVANLDGYSAPVVPTNQQLDALNGYQTIFIDTDIAGGAADETIVFGAPLEAGWTTILGLLRLLAENLGISICSVEFVLQPSSTPGQYSVVFTDISLKTSYNTYAEQVKGLPTLTYSTGYNGIYEYFVKRDLGGDVCTA